MKESIGYTVSLNIMIVFITIVVAFLCAALIYFKSNKASNIITSAIEKYEEYGTEAQNEINMQLTSLGYGSRSIQSKCEKESVISDESGYCSLLEDDNAIKSIKEHKEIIFSYPVQYSTVPKILRDFISFYRISFFL